MLPLLIATSCVVSPLAVTAQTSVLINSFTNPTPAADGRCGTLMLALGDDRVLVGKARKLDRAQVREDEVLAALGDVQLSRLGRMLIDCCRLAAYCP